MVLFVPNQAANVILALLNARVKVVNPLNMFATLQVITKRINAVTLVVVAIAAKLVVASQVVNVAVVMLVLLKPVVAMELLGLNNLVPQTPLAVLKVKLVSIPSPLVKELAIPTHHAARLVK